MLRRVLGAVVVAVVGVAALGVAVGSASFPGRSGRIGFSTLRAKDGAFRIESVRAGGTGRRRMLSTTSTAHLPSGPAYSPDGHQIAFEADGELRVMNANGSGVRTVTSGAFPDSISFSPDGEHLAFTGRAGGSLDIFTVRTDGSELTRLTEDSGQDRQPAWSPNGKLIAFVSNRWNGPHVWLMRADGSGQRLLVARPKDGQVTPDFAPNGRRIAVVKGARVLTMSLDGTHRKVLSGRGTILTQPVYSPDGRSIAAIERHRHGPDDILVMNADGSHRRTIGTHVSSRSFGGIYGLGWQPLPR